MAKTLAPSLNGGSLALTEVKRLSLASAPVSMWLTGLFRVMKGDFASVLPGAWLGFGVSQQAHVNTTNHVVIVWGSGMASHVNYSWPWNQPSSYTSGSYSCNSNPDKISKARDEQNGNSSASSLIGSNRPLLNALIILIALDICDI